MATTIEVAIPGRGYRIEIASGPLGAAGAASLASFVRGRDCVLVTDERVGALYLDAARELLGAAGAAAVHALEFPAGERSKTLATLERLYAECARVGLDRSGRVVALGGGVAGDLAGFLAATWMRGVGLVQLPTSLLAQVDSSVGGKTGVDLAAGKNLVGAFHQPLHVLIDLATLRTLPERELRSGLAEVLKYGAALDAGFFAYLEEHVGELLALDSGTYEHVVARCCALKAGVVLADERDETGRRAVLNHGHTFGHAIEKVAGYGAWTHGEAVAAGMLMAAELAAARAPALRALLERQEALTGALGLPTRAEGLDPRALLAAMRADKKAERGALNLVLPAALGDARLVRDVDEREALSALEARCA